MSNPVTPPIDYSHDLPVVDHGRVATLRSGDGGWILLRPNRSMSRHGLVVAGGLCVVAAIPGLVFSVLLGAWPMLPFLGLEIAAVLLVFGWMLRHQDDHERMVLDADRIVHVRVEGQRRETRSFPRYWARLVVEPPVGRLQRPRLFLRSHGCSTELGRDGSGATRDALARTLIDDFGVVRSSAGRARQS